MANYRRVQIEGETLLLCHREISQAGSIASCNQVKHYFLEKWMTGNIQHFIVIRELVCVKSIEDVVSNEDTGSLVKMFDLVGRAHYEANDIACVT